MSEKFQESMKDTDVLFMEHKDVQRFLPLISM
jgi:hypothetical protein